MTNNMNYDSQICRTLDRDEKCHLFNITISLSQQATSKCMAGGGDPGLEGETNNRDDGNNKHMGLVEELWSPHPKEINFFRVAEQLLVAPLGTNPSPPQFFVAGSIAFHLNREASICYISIDNAAQKFNLPGLQGALGDYLNREGAFAQNFHVFGGLRRSPHNVPLTFNALHI